MSAPRPPLSERDWAQLSAYLDGQLGARQRAALERRLAAEPHLRQALDELRDTVTLLRALPTLRAPRDFTLDPALYARPRRWWSVAAALQFSGALGTALAVVLIALGVLLPARHTIQPSATAQSVALQPTAPSPTPSPMATVTTTPAVMATFALPETEGAADNTLNAETFGEAAAPAESADEVGGAPPQALSAAPEADAAFEEAEAAPPVPAAPPAQAPALREPPALPAPSATPPPTPNATASVTPSATPAPTEERHKLTASAPVTESRPRWWLVWAGSVTLLASVGMWWLGKRRT